jgi:hypothetical protein
MCLISDKALKNSENKKKEEEEEVEKKSKMK